MTFDGTEDALTKAADEIDRLKQFEPLGVEGPHPDPMLCSTYFNGCNCTMATLEQATAQVTSLNGWKKQLEAENAELRKQVSALDKDNTNLRSDLDQIKSLLDEVASFFGWKT